MKHFDIKIKIVVLCLLCTIFIYSGFLTKSLKSNVIKSNNTADTSSNNKEVALSLWQGHYKVNLVGAKFSDSSTSKVFNFPVPGFGLTVATSSDTLTLLSGYTKTVELNNCVYKAVGIPTYYVSASILSDLGFSFYSKSGNAGIPLVFLDDLGSCTIKFKKTTTTTPTTGKYTVTYTANGGLFANNSSTLKQVDVTTAGTSSNKITAKSGYDITTAKITWCKNAKCSLDISSDSALITVNNVTSDTAVTVTIAKTGDTVSVPSDTGGSTSGGSTSGGSTSGGSTTTTPTTETEVCPVDSEAIKISSVEGTYGPYDNHYYTSEGSNEKYYCVNPGNVLPTAGCTEEISLSDMLKGSPNERGRAAILASSYDMETIANSLNVYSCSSQINSDCDDEDRKALMRPVGDAVYDYVETYLATEQTLPSDTTTSGDRQVKITLADGTNAGFNSTYLNSNTKNVLTSASSVYTSPIWTKNRTRTISDVNVTSCTCNGTACSGISLKYDATKKAINVTGLNSLSSSVTTVSCGASVTLTSVASTLLSGLKSSGKLNGLTYNDDIIKLLVEAYLARNDDEYNLLENPYTVTYISDPTIEASNANSNDLKVKVKITSNSSDSALSKITGVAFSTSDGKSDTNPVKQSSTNANELIYVFTIKGGNLSSSGLCTPLSVTAKITYSYASKIIKSIIGNTQKLYAQPASGDSTTSPIVNVPRTNCVTPSCFSGTNSYKSLYTAGKITVDEYTAACCEDADAQAQMGSIYQTYCKGCNNTFDAPTCQAGGSSGSIIEASEKGITSSNYTCLTKKTDINGDSFLNKTSRYCKSYCKEDAEYKIQGFGYNPKTEYSIIAGQYFTFESYDGEENLPWFHQTRTCVVTMDYAKYMSDMYGTSYSLGSISSLSETQAAASTGGYYGAAKQGVKDYVSGWTSYYTYKAQAESLATAYTAAKNVADSLYDTWQGKEATATSTCHTFGSTSSRCKTAKQSAASAESAYNSANNNATSILNQKTTAETNRDNSKNKADAGAAAYATNVSNIKTANTDYETCTSFSQEYTTADLPTLVNFYYSEMNNPGSDVKDVISQISVVPKTKTFAPANGVAGISSYLNDSWASQLVNKNIFTIDGSLPAISAGGNATSIINSIFASNLSTATQEKFFKYGLSNVQATVSYGLGVEMFSLIPSGNLITSKSTLFGTADVLKMGFGLPVSISTRAAKYIYRFEIANFGKNGKLSKAFSRSMGQNEYICNYYVGNVITCPTDSTCVTCSPNATSMTNDVGSVTRLSNTIKTDNQSSSILSEYKLLASSSSCSSTEIYRQVITKGELVPFARTVSLSDLNPNNRTEFSSNSNWSTAAGKAVQNAIQEKGDSVYEDEEPMYSFTLDTTTINEIKEYNDETTYGDFDLDCDDETGKYCISEFVKKYATNDINTARENWNEYDSTTNKIVDKIVDNTNG